MKEIIHTKRRKIKQRVTWGFSPVTRVKPSKKIYSRKNNKINYKSY